MHSSAVSAGRSPKRAPRISVMRARSASSARSGAPKRRTGEKPRAASAISARIRSYSTPGSTCVGCTRISVTPSAAMDAIASATVGTISPALARRRMIMPLVQAR